MSRKHNIRQGEFVHCEEPSFIFSKESLLLHFLVETWVPSNYLQYTCKEKKLIKQNVPTKSIILEYYRLQGITK